MKLPLWRQGEETKMQVETLERSNAPARDQSRMERPRILLLPGLDNSGPGHWQTYWESMSHFSRVDLGSWGSPRLHQWVEALDRAIRESSRPVVLAAHSLGCLAAAWWAQLHWTEAFQEKVRGALLVAPPDVDALDLDARLRDFRPLPRFKLPFRSILVASRDDPTLAFKRATELARSWGSDLVDAGKAGHINAASGIGEWPAGLRHLAGLTDDAPNLLVTELGLRTALA